MSSQRWTNLLSSGDSDDVLIFSYAGSDGTIDFGLFISDSATVDYELTTDAEDEIFLAYTVDYTPGADLTDNISRASATTSTAWSTTRRR